MRLVRLQPLIAHVFAVIRKDDGNGPAVTLDIRYQKRSQETVFSVDIVPAVRLLEWPHPAKDWTSCWLSPDEVLQIKNPEYHDSVIPFLVPKIHPTGISI